MPSDAEPSAACSPRPPPLVVPDGVFVDDDQGLRFELLPVPTNANVLAILDRLLLELPRRGQFDVLAIDGGWVEPESMASHEAMTAGGAIRISPLAVQGLGRRWSFQLDGGFLGLAGAGACDQAECPRGAYRLALGRRFGDALVEARAGRDAFLAADDTMALEDRFTVTAAGVHGRHRLATSGFLAYTRAWAAGGGGATGGVDATWSVDLGHGLWSMVRGERARSYYGTTEGERTPLIEASSRLMVGVGWSRGRGAPTTPLAR